MRLLTLLLLIVVFSFGNNSQDTWKYKDWEIRDDTKNWIRTLTRGNIVKGHQLGIIKSKKNCESDLLSLTISTYEKDAKSLKGKQLKFEFKFEEESVFLNLNVTTINKVSSLMSIAMFTNFKINKNFLDLMKKSTSLKVNILEPKSLKDKFDLTSESFSLKGFVANYTKLQEMCKSSISKKKEYINKNILPIENSNKGLRKYNKRVNLSTLIFNKIYKKFGADIRNSVILEVCEMENISKKIAPTNKEIIDFIAEEIPKDIAQTDLDYFFSIISSTNERVIGYQLGYLESQKVMKKILKNYCKTASMIAEEEKIHSRRN